MMTNEECKVYVDGSWMPNPGKGGWAYTSIIGTNSGTIEGCKTTSNEMDIISACKAIEDLYTPQRRLLILSDSEYLVKGITEWVHLWLQNNWKNGTIKNRDAWEELYSLVRSRWIRFDWIRSHSCKETVEVKRLANVAAGIKHPGYHYESKVSSKVMSYQERNGQRVTEMKYFIKRLRG
jgi:ribonuclease HI